MVNKSNINCFYQIREMDLLHITIPYEECIEKASNVLFPIATIVPYCFYSLAYKKPETFKKIMTQDSLVLGSSIIKAVGMFFFSFECLRSQININSLPLGLPLIIVGQLFNYLIYKKFGKVRAYYGWELGLDNNPPCEGFPLNIGHSQYKGCLFSTLGTYLCFNPTFRLTLFTTLWSIMYFFITLVESTNPGRKEKDA